MNDVFIPLIEIFSKTEFYSFDEYVSNYEEMISFKTKRVKSGGGYVYMSNFLQNGNMIYKTFKCVPYMIRYRVHVNYLLSTEKNTTVDYSLF